MQKARNVKGYVERVGIAAIFCLAATAGLEAAEPGAGTGDVPTVTPMESTVLPNAPKVGDKPTTSPMATPMTTPMAPSAAPPAPAPTTGEAPPPVSPAEVKGSPDWPCVQRKMPTISPAQIWDGPSIDNVKGWESDEKIQELTSYVESRRVPLDQVEKAIKEYAQSLPAAERDKKLTELFASVLSKINSDRQFVMGRVEEFQRRQKARAEELEREGRKLAESNQEIPPEEQYGPRDTKLSPEQQEYNWNARIFQDRQQNLSVACEIPVLIEQRAYELSKLIRAQMSS
jgi:hypothetical protein